jgi:hypothetical protein
MNPSLVSNFIQFPTAKQVWDSIAVTYFDGTDTSQVYNLKRRVNRMKHVARQKNQRGIDWRFFIICGFAWFFGVAT